ncbi:LOG family protein [Chitinophaga pinensis]|uniref:Cytokinin riboside 5'-monophosphate phosphoribohydrolase n=1 Tax=Chitinophaga pinensis (strain ATCC 43595 / DSM 2588 / LMG 13176 / NBRC 15968 / NCIMB 11800 / UQM 2034) TaxID=485918 RepID=A0A979GAZ4_CHIPD|nr:TIGR00730 family Rossman fold protein [Chitinophaga pinensis]ACU64061.1 conserved hypothetical protein [Chitinophaga pinensis DSM 2588]
MKSIAIFCGSNFGKDPVYKEATIELARCIVKNNLRLVYGGAAVGLMGLIADEVLALGGQVIGVLPEKLRDREVGHKNLTELHIVSTMHERKAMMANLSDYFVAIPGGIGTLEEIVEVFTWAQLGLHAKPCGMLNINGFYDKFRDLLASMSQEGFLSEHQFNSLIFDNEPESLLHKVMNQQVEYHSKWVK